MVFVLTCDASADCGWLGSLPSWPALVLRGAVDVTSVPGTTYPFDRPATFDRVADLAATWFVGHLRPLSATG